jgi:hypothetical protein
MVSGMAPQETGPQVPSGLSAQDYPPGMPVPVEGGPLMDRSQLPPGHDYSQTDDWETYLDKQIRAGLQGTVSGVSKGADAMWNTAVDTPYNTYKMFGTDEPYSPNKYAPTNDQPITDYSQEKLKQASPYLFEETPGSDYEATRENAEVLGPLALGAGGPAIVNLAKKVPEAVMKPLLTTARDAGLGYIGGETGGYVGEQVGGEKGRAIGTIFGSLGTPVLSAAAGRYALRKTFTDEDSADIVQTIDDVNAMLPDYAPKIPATLGLVGSKNAGLVEDILGRGVVSGGPPMAARKQQYAGTEAAIQDAVARTRGTNQTPIPATEKITPETIGNKASDAAVKGVQRAHGDIEKYSKEIENLIGKQTSVDVGDIDIKLEDIVNDTTKGNNVRAEAQFLLDQLRAHYPPQSTITTSPTGSTLTNPLPNTRQPNYGQVFDVRRNIGTDVQGNKRDIGQEMEDITYKGLTEAMGETAKKQGMTDWEVKQAKIKQAADDRRDMNKIAGEEKGGSPKPKQEKEAFNTLFSGAKKGGVRHLDAYERNVPDDIAEILADKLELELRGDVNAGLPAPRPETFDMDAIGRNWSARSDEYKDVFSQNDAAVRAQLDRVAKLAEKEQVRPGRRTVPGKTGSTIGATQQMLNPAILGTLATGKFAGALLGPILSAGGSYGLGRLMTNPAFVRELANKTGMSLSSILSKAVSGGLAGANILNRDEGKARRAEEEQSKYEEHYGGKKNPHGTREPTDIGTIRPPKKKGK